MSSVLANSVTKLPLQNKFTYSVKREEKKLRNKKNTEVES